jgi:hypothetical protein
MRGLELVAWDARERRPIPLGGVDAASFVEIDADA